MRQAIAGILALMMSGTCLGQISGDEASKRMAEKIAAREAQRAVVVSIKQGELDDLNAEISRLKSQVLQLQNSLAAEKKKEAAAAAKEAAKAAQEAKAKEIPDPIATAIRDHTLAIGMTLDQANMSMGAMGTKTGESKDGVEYSWPLPRTTTGGPGGNSGLSRRSSMQTTHFRKAVFKDGMLTEFHTDE